MLFCMRTTLNLDDGLMVAAKTRAAERGITLTRVVEDALRLSLNGTGPRKPGIVSLPVFEGGSLAPGVSEDDLLSNARLQELLEPSDEIRREFGLE